MCGSLRLEGTSYWVPQGSSIPSVSLVGAARERESYFWPQGGFCRIDGSRDGSKTMPEQWDPRIWHPAALKVDSFKERGTVFKSFKLACLLQDDEGLLRILTRPAKTEKEILVHHRAPSRIPNDWGLIEYVSQLNQLLGGNHYYV